jgi:hypothetical protein
MTLPHLNIVRSLRRQGIAGRQLAAARSFIHEQHAT